VDYFDGAGKRREKGGFVTKKAAEAWRVQTAGEVVKGVHTADSVSITVAVAAQIWLDRVEAKGREKGTRVQYENHVRKYIVPKLAGEKLSALTSPAVERFLDHLIREDVSPAMARKILASLKAMISEAQRRGLVAQNVALASRVETSSRKRRLEVGVDIPSREEVGKILAAADGRWQRWRPLLVTKAFTGLRSSELRGLRWVDVDFERKIITVAQRADAWNVIGAPKSKTSARRVPMAPMVTNTLREWRLAGRPGPYVFPNSKGNIESHSNIQQRGFDPIQKAAQVVDAEGKPKYSLHALRHYFASAMAHQGASLKRVQGWMGHSTLAMTADTYAHLFRDDEDDAARFEAAERALVAARPA
jgi:integrase